MAAAHARSSVKRRAAGIAEYSRRARRRRQELAARLQRARRCSACSTTPPSTIRPNDSGDAKILRRRLIQAGIFDSRAVAFFFVARTALAVGPGASARSSSCRCWSSQKPVDLLAVRDGRRHRRLYRAELLHRPAHRQEQGRAPLGLPGLHGPHGGVRGFRPEHGGGAGAGRARARRQLSVALRQHPHDQSRNPRRQEP